MLGTGTLIAEYEMDDMHTLRLPEAFDRKAIAQFAPTLMGHRGDDAALDASAVNRMGALAVELLIAARKQWQADGKALTILNASPAFLACLADIGASSEMLQAEACA